MNDYVVRRGAVVVAPLDGPRPRFPDLDGSVLGARHHPFPLAVECDSRDIPSVALKHKQRCRIGGADVEELDGMVAGCGEKPLIGGDT